MQPPDDAAVSHTDKNSVRRLPVKLFADLIGGGFLAFGHVRVETGVAVVPAVSTAGFQAKLKGLVIGSLYQKDAGAEYQQLGDFRLGCGFGNKNHIWLLNAGAQTA